MLGPASRLHQQDLMREAKRERLAFEAMAPDRERREAKMQESIAALKAMATSHPKPARRSWRRTWLARLGLRPA